MNNHMLISKFTTCKDRRKKETQEDKAYIKEVRKYVRARNAALNEYSIEALKKFHATWKDFAGLADLPNDDVLEIVLNKMCIHATNIYPKVKKKAKTWLLEHGFSLEIK